MDELKREKLQIYQKRDIYKNEMMRLNKLKICKTNKTLIIKYHDEIRLNGAKDERIVKVSWQLRRMAALLNKPFNRSKEDDFKKLITSLDACQCTNKGKEGRPISEATKEDYIDVLKQFMKWLKNSELLPKEIAFLKKRKKKKVEKPFNVITWEDIHACRSFASNPRDVAFLYFLYESGARIGEVLNMRICDVDFKENHAIVNLDGKTGKRTIPIVVSIAYLAQYLNIHPRTNSEDYFWISTSDKNRRKPLLYPGAVMLIRNMFKLANITKRCNVHSFRHSRATELASKLTEPQMRLYFGWTKESDVPAVYTHLSGRDIEEPVLKLNGIKIEGDPKVAKNLTCPICKTTAAPKTSFCPDCGYGLSVEAIYHSEEKVNTEIDKTMSFMMEMAKNPELLKQFEEYRKKLGLL